MKENIYKRLSTYSFPQEIVHIDSDTFKVSDILLKDQENTKFEKFYDEVKAKFDKNGKNLNLELILDEDLDIVEEGYVLSVNKDKITIKYKDNLGLKYALMKLKNILLSNGFLFEFEIKDYPRLKERRLLLDIGRKYFSKKWIMNLIDEMSKMKMNTILIHFSENKGFRIESEFDPDIVSKDNILTKNDIRDIIEHAKDKDISIIPGLDSPGHLDYVLKTRPEFGQVDINGDKCKYALDIISEESKEYIKNLYREYLELFKGVKYFHIGGDEYMPFTKEEFNTLYKPVFEEYAKTFGDKPWTFPINLYLNEIADLILEHGILPRVWNDCLHYGEKTLNWVNEKLNDKIGVDYWSNIAWDGNVVNASYILDKGYGEIYNSNATFFYYILRQELPEEGRKQHSWDFDNQYERIYDMWTPGNFAGEKIDDEDPRIKGASVSIWCDNPEITDEDTIFNEIRRELRTFSAKAWNYKINEKISLEEYFENIENIEESNYKI